MYIYKYFVVFVGSTGQVDCNLVASGRTRANRFVAILSTLRRKMWCMFCLKNSSIHSHEERTQCLCPDERSPSDPSTCLSSSTIPPFERFNVGRSQFAPLWRTSPSSFCSSYEATCSSCLSCRAFLLPRRSVTFKPPSLAIISRYSGGMPSVVRCAPRTSIATLSFAVRGLEPHLYRCVCVDAQQKLIAKLRQQTVLGISRATKGDQVESTRFSCA